MFQAFDNPGPGRPLGRAQWMALLARAPLGLLESALQEHATRPARWLRAPETGLMMVQGRAGGTGERFNLGEVTVTRCALRVADASDAAEATVGVAYVLGRSHRQVQLAALADALASIGRPGRWRLLDAAQIEPGETHRVEVAFRLDLSLLPRPFQIGLGNDPDWTVQFQQRLTVPDAVEPDR